MSQFRVRDVWWICALFCVAVCCAVNASDVSVVALEGNLDTAASTGTNGSSCSVRDKSKETYPSYILDLQTRRQGGIILHFLIAIYGFVTIALVCEDYFLPAVECICQDLSLPADVAAATFMSMATSTPELFVNVISTFLTESDMGVGTTVGSATFNVLGIATFSGLAAVRVIRLRRWPIWRDSIGYMVAVVAMTIVVWDDKVEWYEAFIMLLLAISYLLFMFTHRCIGRIFHTESKLTLTTHRVGVHNTSVATIESAMAEAKKADPKLRTPSIRSYRSDQEEVMNHFEEEPTPLCEVPNGVASRVWWVISMPIAFVLMVTIPSPRRQCTRRLYPLAFLLCVVWIAISAYMVSWMLSIVGETFSIPDAVMGLTFMAAGGSMPEGISSVIMARKGVGSMGISNGLGANTLNVLMNLGSPWLIKSLMTHAPVELKSNALAYNCLALIAAVVSLNLLLFFVGYKLSTKQGILASLLYASFIAFMVLSELRILPFLPNANSPC